MFRRSLAIIVLLAVFTLAAHAQSGDPNPECEPSTSYLGQLVDWFYELMGWTSAEAEEAARPPEPSPLIEAEVPVVVEPPEEPEPEPSRYDTIPMDACAKKVTQMDLRGVTNLVEAAECKTQHPCAMKSIFDDVADDWGIDRPFYYALKWRESRWQHWSNDALTQVKVSPTNDWGVAQINKSSFEGNYSDRFDWEQVVSDPLYNTRVGAEILNTKNRGGFPGCYDYAEDRLRDHYDLRVVLEALIDEPDDSPLLAKAREVAALPRNELPQPLPSQLPPALRVLPRLTVQGQNDLKNILSQDRDRWQQQIDTAPLGDDFSVQDVNEAAYACYNGGPSKWRRPWYTRTRYKQHVELFRAELEQFSDLNELVWDDDFIDTLTGKSDQDLKQLLLGLRDCTERSS